jgi:aspartate aminotransferase-like enzyme
MTATRTLLLNPGPVTLTERVRAALARPDLCHREPEFAALQGRIRAQLLALYGLAPDTWTAILLTGSGTAAVEAMVASLVPRAGRLLVLESGVYGERLRRMAEIHGIAHASQARPWGADIDWDGLAAELAQGNYSHAAVVHHETTTGRLHDLPRLAALCAAHGVALLVDGVSSFGAEAIPFYIAGEGGGAAGGVQGLSAGKIRIAAVATLMDLVGEIPWAATGGADRRAAWVTPEGIAWAVAGGADRRAGAAPESTEGSAATSMGSAPQPPSLSMAGAVTGGLTDGGAAAVGSVGAVGPVGAGGIAAVAGTANKCLHGCPGVAFVIARRAALAEAEPRSVYLDLAGHHRAQDAGTTAFTPAVPACHALDEALAELIEQGGPTTRLAHYRELAAVVRAGLAAAGIAPLLSEVETSAVLAAYRLPPGLSYPRLHDHLKARGFIIYAGQGALAESLFRVSVMGDITRADMERFTAAVATVATAV